MVELHVLNTKGNSPVFGLLQNLDHKLVSQGRLKAYIYDGKGTLAERQATARWRGQGLYFRSKDVDLYQPDVQRRPRGSKNNT